MKFGSVNFFKQLIISTVICIVIFAASFSMIFGIKASSESIRVSDKLPESADAMADAAEEKNPAGSHPPEETDISEGESEPPEIQTSAKTEKTDKNESVTAEGTVHIPENATVAEIYGAITDNGISSKDIIDYISENDGEYLDELISGEAEKLSAEFLNTDAPTEDIPTSVALSADDYPELYVQGGDMPAVTEGTVCLAFESIVPDYLNDIFCILGNQDTSAMFFLTCEELEELSDSRLAAFAEKGCVLGISLTGTGSVEEMNRAYERICTATGNTPYAYICDNISESVEKELEERGFVRFGGETVSGSSWTEVYRGARDIVDSSEGGTFLRLDGGYYSVITAEDIISLLKDDGYTFVI